MKIYYLLGSLFFFFIACEKGTNLCSKEATGLSIVQGQNQQEGPYTELPIPLRVKLNPDQSNYCTDLIVHFEVLSGGGSFREEAVPVDKFGYAEAYWTLGGAQGVQRAFSYINGDTLWFSAKVVETMTDPRDGQVYQLVTIGTQTWMAENLRYDVPNVGSDSAIVDTAYHAFDAIYGRIYDWGTIMNGELSSSANPSGVQGICPDGWHVPSDAEFSVLEIALGMDPQDSLVLGARGTHGLEMKSTDGWNNYPGNNASGFNAYPTGRYGPPLYFYGQNRYANFKSSTESSSAHGLGREVSYLSHEVVRGGFSKDYAGSCRCVRD